MFEIVWNKWDTNALWESNLKPWKNGAKYKLTESLGVLRNFRGLFGDGVVVRALVWVGVPYFLELSDPLI